MRTKSKLHLMMYCMVGKHYYMHPTSKISPKIMGEGKHEPYEVVTDYLHPASIVYSFGVGNDLNLELELMKEYGVNIYCYDPTPVVEKYVKDTIEMENAFKDTFFFYPYALTNNDKKCKFYFPEDDGCSGSLGQDLVTWHRMSDKYTYVDGYCLKSLMNMNKHDHIDYVKLCVEGIERDVVKSIVEDEIDIKQISIALCGRGSKNGYTDAKDIYRMMTKGGYKLLEYMYPGHVTFIKQ